MGSNPTQRRLPLSISPLQQAKLLPRFVVPASTASAMVFHYYNKVCVVCVGACFFFQLYFIFRGEVGRGKVVGVGGREKAVALWFA